MAIFGAPFAHTNDPERAVRDEFMQNELRRLRATASEAGLRIAASALDRCVDLT